MPIKKSDDYLNALLDLNSDQLLEKEWISMYFDLYRASVNWPIGLPPIQIFEKEPSGLRSKFISTFEEMLPRNEISFNNYERSLKNSNELDHRMAGTAPLDIDAPDVFKIKRVAKAPN